ncbi:arsenate reductase ArsC [Nakamurella endophytica]|uniref:Low molecular weight phosphatase family protein n=1 Tax=Nakamurella endophytica TaxID=1748367 RepID=A0A917T5E3_9ACTN|nr:arsenate reductase ArsC [Nakamurella endophytica]GGM09902.1 low molecular weight phosphatase family protein [Nakamurella endophytica]
MTAPSAPAPSDVDAAAIPRDTLLDITARLCTRFAGVFSAETVERYVFESYATLRRTSRVTTFLPVLTQRFAQDRLTALAQAKGKVDKDVPEVLFVCVHNSGRSQMAAALLTARAGGRVHVRSAGSLPAAQINPVVVQALEEVAVDLVGEFPKPLTDDVVSAADVVVTMGCGDACAVYSGKRYLDWQLPDPEGLPLEQVRAIRDDLDQRVRALLTELVGEAGRSSDQAR